MRPQLSSYKALVHGSVRDTNGIAFDEPVALKPDWALQVREPLPSPHVAYHCYLSSIFTVSSSLDFTTLSQILQMHEDCFAA